jgi:hypothetical protein
MYTAAPHPLSKRNSNSLWKIAKTRTRSILFNWKDLYANAAVAACQSDFRDLHFGVRVLASLKPKLQDRSTYSQPWTLSEDPRL